MPHPTPVPLSAFPLFSAADFSPNPPADIAAWLACAFFGIAFLNAALKLVDRLKDKPAPGDVQATLQSEISHLQSQFVPKADYLAALARNDREHENIFAKLGGIERGIESRLGKKLDDMSAEARDAREKIHQRINRLSTGLARIGGKLDVFIEEEGD